MAKALVIGIVSDTHAGGTTALCPAKIQLDDGGEYRASKPQQWLWNRWENFYDRVEQTRRKLKAKLLLEFNGDLTDGNHHGTTQILSGNPTAQAAVVNAVMKVPLALQPDHLVFIRGTEAHVGPSAAYEERIAVGLEKDGWPVVMDKVTGNASHWHWTMEEQGVRFDFAHHGRVGQRPWTKPNVVVNLAAEIFLNHASAGRPHPHLAIRSHMHQFVDTFNVHPTRVIQTPAYQLATAYIHRIAPGAIADVGGIIVTVVNGEMTVIPVVDRPTPEAPWQR